MTTLRSRLLRVAQKHPEVRAHVLPLLKEAALPRAIYLPRNNPTLTLRKNTPPGLEVWVWETETPKGTAYNAVAFFGKASKPMWLFRFRDIAQQEKQISETIQNVQGLLDAKAKAQSARAQFTHGYNVGDLLTGSWGYDQTQVSAFQVVGVPSPKVVVLREVGTQTVKREFGANYVVPVSGAFKGPPVKKIPGPHGVRVESFLTVSKWDGKPQYETPFEMGH